MMMKIFCLLSVCLMIVSCRSVKYVPVESKMETRDSVVVRDSVVMREVTNYRDSVVTKDSTVLVVDENGNVIRTELYRQKEIYRALQKEYDMLLERYKKLESQKVDTIRVPYPVEKPLTRWQKWKLDLGGFAMAAIVITVLVVVGRMVYKLKK